LPVSIDALDARLKRVLDVGASLLLLFVFAPLIALLALAIKLDSRGPVFYRCKRMGFRGSDLYVLKFRKMRVGAQGPALTSRADPRFTRIGRHLAKFRLDEIPQLWNVFRGEMSLVGPRPEDPIFVALHADEYRNQILQVPPGITGLTQLAFADEGTIMAAWGGEDAYRERLLPQKVALDSLYAARRSLWMDMRVVLWTIGVVLLGLDLAVHRETGRITIRRRPRIAAVEPKIVPQANRP
jgi:lipopolysaccharide/colanic/teichoic acid biosynthesis glycosyltransferase